MSALARQYVEGVSGGCMQGFPTEEEALHYFSEMLSKQRVMVVNKRSDDSTQPAGPTGESAYNQNSFMIQSKDPHVVAATHRTSVFFFNPDKCLTFT